MTYLKIEAVWYLPRLLCSMLDEFQNWKESRCENFGAGGGEQNWLFCFEFLNVQVFWTYEIVTDVSEALDTPSFDTQKMKSTCLKRG